MQVIVWAPAVRSGQPMAVVVVVVVVVVDVGRQSPQ